MKAPKCTEHDYINFLVAAHRVFRPSEAARSHPDGADTPAHDAYPHLLHRLPPDSAVLWAEVHPSIDRSHGLLVIDDTTLDKPYASQMALVTRHWSGKQQAVVQGINLTSLVWTDGAAACPCDFRLYPTAEDGLSKNDPLRDMLETAQAPDFQPAWWPLTVGTAVWRTSNWGAVWVRRGGRD
jgi:DDE superfamily endonuclease